MEHGLPQLGQFDSTIQQWIDQLEHYTVEQLHRAPRAGSWSLGQVYVHIINDTGWFVEQMEAALSTRIDGDKAMHPDARRMFENNGFPDARIEGPATNTFILQPAGSAELATQLSAIKTAVHRLFGGLGPEVSGGKTRHPGLGYFSAVEWLQFAEMHMRHHLRQKQRIDAVLFG